MKKLGPIINLLSAIILAAGMITSIYIYKRADRYVFVNEYSSGYVVKIDKWTGIRTIIETSSGNEIKGCKLNDRGFPVPAH